ncbi:CB070 protein, partial [Chauna torquata]|nr:CB070 protein [Chauna torquata]
LLPRTPQEHHHDIPTGPPAPCPEEGHCPPLHTCVSLDGGRSLELSRFYQLTQQQRAFYQDKTATIYPVPYFVLSVKEKQRYPHPLGLPPLSGKTRWHLLRVSPENLRTYQTFPSGKRVTSQEREIRDSFFRYRA